MVEPESKVPVAPSQGSATRPSAAPRRLRSRDLFGSSREIRIEHEGVEYRLRRTRHEKLILTK